MADVDQSAGRELVGLRHYARGLLDAGQTASQAIGALMVKGLEHEAAGQLVSELLDSTPVPAPPPAAAAQEQSARTEDEGVVPPDAPIAHYRSANGRLVLAALLAGLLVLLAGGVALAGVSNKDLTDDGAKLFVLGLCLAVGLAGLAAIWEYVRRWSEELTVYPSGVVRRYNGAVETVPWSAVAAMEVEVGGWLIEWVLLQFEQEVPRLVVRTVAGGRWVYRFNMAPIGHLCQVVPAVWTAHRAGMR